MIFYWVISALFATIAFLLSLIPSIPAMPPAIADPMNFLLNFLSGAFNFIVHIYTPVLAGAIVAMCLGLLFFNQGYYVVMFIVRKLKIVG